MCEPVETELSELDDVALGALVDDLDRRAAEVEAQRLMVLGVWDARAGWAADGACSGAGWLAARGRSGRAASAGLVGDARRLRSMPATAAALAAGGLGAAKARLLCRAVNERTRAAFNRDETMLIRTLAGLTVDQAALAIRYWLAHADTDGPNPTDRAANSWSQYQSVDGRWYFKGNLDIESGSEVAGEIEARVEAARRARRDAGDNSHLAGAGPRLRADALVEMARRASATPDTAVAARPLLWVLAGADQLATGQGAAELVGAGPISAVVAARLACDADWARLTVDGDRLHLGRTQRRATATQRRLLTIRDGGCRFPGCDRPPGWCEAHHIVFWDHGGPTDLDNLVLLCSHHHHLCHEGGYHAAAQPDGHITFTRPDGTRIEPPPIAA